MLMALYNLPLHGAKWYYQWWCPFDASVPNSGGGGGGGGGGPRVWSPDRESREAGLAAHHTSLTGLTCPTQATGTHRTLPSSATSAMHERHTVNTPRCAATLPPHSKPYTRDLEAQQRGQRR